MSYIWRWLRVIFLTTGILYIFSTCVNRPFAPADKQIDLEVPKFFPQSLEKDVDILFLIDNSPSMSPKQEKLKANFDKLIDGLRSVNLGPAPGATKEECEADRNKCNIPNLRLGVVSTDLGVGKFSGKGIDTCEIAGGDQGYLQNQPHPAGCPTPENRHAVGSKLDNEEIRWIEYTIDSDGKAKTNVPDVADKDEIDEVKEAFKCIAYLGEGGCSFEQPLEAVYQALDPKSGKNKGFIRDDAFLAIVFITDEDDCSVKNDNLFDPSSQTVNDPLGPMNSFRCTEFGIKCDEPDQTITDRRAPGVRHNCKPGYDWLQPVDRYITLFKDIKPSGRLMLFAIAGPYDPQNPLEQFDIGTNDTRPFLKPTCRRPTDKDPETGVPAVRLKTVVEAFNEDGYYNKGLDDNGNVMTVNICDENFGPALRLIGERLIGAIGTQCLTKPPLTATGSLACMAGDDIGGGVKCQQSCLDKAECTVADVRKVGDETSSTTISKCPSALFDANITSCGDTCPCWRIVPFRDSQHPNDPNLNCEKQGGSPYRIEILRNKEVEKGTMADVRCRSAYVPWGSAELAKLPQCDNK